MLGELLQHCGTRRNVQKQRDDGSKIRVNVEVTYTTRPISSVKNGADIVEMTIFEPCGGRRVIRDAEAIQKIVQHLDRTEGFNVVNEKGVCVLDTKASPSSSERYVQPVISSNKLERVLSQAAKEHERKRTLETIEHEKNLQQPDKPRNNLQNPTSRHSKSGRNTE